METNEAQIFKGGDARRKHPSSGTEGKTEKTLSDLRREVGDAVAQALRAPEGGKEDIAPLIKFVGGELEGSGIINKDSELAGYEKRRIFWDLVGGSLKENVFGKIYGKIVPLIERGEYNGAEELIVKELREAVKSLSPTLYRNQDELAAALIELKRKFYEALPEVKALIYHGELEGKKPKTKIPREETFKEHSPKAPAKRPEPFAEFFGEEHFIKKRTWGAPNIYEIKPGFVIEEYSANNFREVLLVLSKPFLDDSGDWWIMARNTKDGNEGKMSLADLGIVPYSWGGWNKYNHPVRWYMSGKGEMPGASSGK